LKGNKCLFIWVPVNLVWPELKFDQVTIFLIIVIILPLLTPVFKTLELPGGLKLEYNLDKATKEEKVQGYFLIIILEKLDLVLNSFAQSVIIAKNFFYD
jgi:ABC-type microcin C transport system permease subunit YejB